MEEIIRIIKEKIEELKKLQSDYTSKKQEINDKITKAINYCNYPETIRDSFEDFCSIYNGLEDNPQIRFICDFTDYLETNPDEPQVIEALSFLKKEEARIIEELGKELQNLPAEPEHKKIKSCENLVKTLENYSSDTYIKIELLDRVRSIVGDSQELLELYMTVAYNNAMIDLAKIEELERAEIIPIEIVEELDRERNIPSEEESTSVTNKSSEYSNKINEFIHNDEYKNLNEELFMYASIIMSKVLSYINSDNDIDFDYVEDLNKDFISMIDNEVELHVLTAYLLFNAYSNNDISEVEKIINSYKYNPKSDIEIFLKSEKMNEYSDLIKKMYEIIGDEELILSASTANFEEYVDKFDHDDLHFEDKKYNYRYELAIIYNEINVLLSSRTLQDDEKKYLEERKDIANKIIEKYNSLIVSNVEQNPIELKRKKVKEFYGSNPENVIVFLKPEEFNSSVDTLERVHRSETDVRKELFDILKSLNENDALYIRRNSHNIRISQSVENDYNICDYPAKSRKYSRISIKFLGKNKYKKKSRDASHFKKLETEDSYNEIIDKPNVIVVMHSCYGRTDGVAKAEELQLALSMFEEYYKSYNELIDAFNADKNKDELSDEVIDLLYKSIDIINSLGTSFNPNDILPSDSIVQDNDSDEFGSGSGGLGGR